MVSGLKALYWILVALAVVFFWFSLRGSEDQMKNAMIALVCWGVAYGLNRVIKKKESQ